MLKQIQKYIVSIVVFSLFIIPSISFATTIVVTEQTTNAITVQVDGLNIGSSYRINIFDKANVLIKKWDITSATSTFTQTTSPTTFLIPNTTDFAEGKYTVKISDGSAYVGETSFDVVYNTKKLIIGFEKVSFESSSEPIITLSKVAKDGSNICKFEHPTEGWECDEYEFPTNTQITLTLSNLGEMIFSSWSGCVGKSTTCTVKMDTDRTVTAIFKKDKAVTISSKNPPNPAPAGNPPAPTPQNPTPNTPPSSGSSTPSSSGLSGNLIPCGTSYNTTPCHGENGWNNLMTLINNVIRFIFIDLTIPIAAISFAYAGFLLLTSGGEAAKKTKAKKIFLNVAIGLIFIAASWLIISTILSVLGYSGAGSFGF